jgi:hypothetical protein
LDLKKKDNSSIMWIGGGPNDTDEILIPVWLPEHNRRSEKEDES